MQNDQWRQKLELNLALLQILSTPKDELRDELVRDLRKLALPPTPSWTGLTLSTFLLYFRGLTEDFLRFLHSLFLACVCSLQTCASKLHIRTLAVRIVFFSLLVSLFQAA